MFGDVNIINNQNKILRTWKDDCQPDLRGYWWTPPHTTTYIHKNLYSEYGLYDESYKISVIMISFVGYPEMLSNNLYAFVTHWLFKEMVE